MMKSYHRSVRVNPIGAIATRISWFIVACIVIWYLFLPTSFASTILSIAEMFWSPADTVNNSQPLTSRQDLIDENNNLRRQLEAIGGAQLSSDAIQAENSELKSALGRSSNSKSLHTILASVVVRPPYTLYDNLVIDVGNRDGIIVDAPVFALGTTTEIGRVASVGVNQSMVRLHSSPGEEFDVLIGVKHVAVRATGKGNGSLEVTLPRDAGVEIGDFVISPTLSSNYIGKIESLDLESTRTFLKALISLPINPSSIRFVEVGKEAGIKGIIK